MNRCFILLSNVAKNKRNILFTSDPFILRYAPSIVAVHVKPKSYYHDTVTLRRKIAASLHFMKCARNKTCTVANNISVQISLIHKNRYISHEGKFSLCTREESISALLPSHTWVFLSPGIRFGCRKVRGILNASHLDSILCIGVAANRVLEA